MARVPRVDADYCLRNSKTSSDSRRRATTLPVETEAENRPKSPMPQNTNLKHRSHPVVLVRASCHDCWPWKPNSVTKYLGIHKQAKGTRQHEIENSKYTECHSLLTLLQRGRRGNYYACTTVDVVAGGFGGARVVSVLVYECTQIVCAQRDSNVVE
jgi:hypothetical protein